MVNLNAGPGELEDILARSGRWKKFLFDLIGLGDGSGNDLGPMLNVVSERYSSTHRLFEEIAFLKYITESIATKLQLKGSP